jgi:hypothetical protein
LPLFTLFTPYNYVGFKNIPARNNVENENLHRKRVFIVISRCKIVKLSTTSAHNEKISICLDMKTSILFYFAPPNYFAYAFCPLITLLLETFLHATLLRTKICVARELAESFHNIYNRIYKE